MRFSTGSAYASPPHHSSGVGEIVSDLIRGNQTLNYSSIGCICLIRIKVRGRISQSLWGKRHAFYLYEVFGGDLHPQSAYTINSTSQPIDKLLLLYLPGQKQFQLTNPEKKGFWFTWRWSQPRTSIQNQQDSDILQVLLRVSNTHSNTKKLQKTTNWRIPLKKNAGLIIYILYFSSFFSSKRNVKWFVTHRISKMVACFFDFQGQPRSPFPHTAGSISLENGESDIFAFFHPWIMKSSGVHLKQSILYNSDFFPWIVYTLFITSPAISHEAVKFAVEAYLSRPQSSTS